MCKKPVYVSLVLFGMLIIFCFGNNYKQIGGAVYEHQLHKQVQASTRRQVCNGGAARFHAGVNRRRLPISSTLVTYRQKERIKNTKLSGTSE